MPSTETSTICRRHVPASSLCLSTTHPPTWTMSPLASSAPTWLSCSQSFLLDVSCVLDMSLVFFYYFLLLSNNSFTLTIIDIIRILKCVFVGGGRELSRHDCPTSCWPCPPLCSVNFQLAAVSSLWMWRYHVTARWAARRRRLSCSCVTSPIPTSTASSNMETRTSLPVRMLVPSFLPPSRLVASCTESYARSWLQVDRKQFCRQFVIKTGHEL